MNNFVGQRQTTALTGCTRIVLAQHGEKTLALVDPLAVQCMSYSPWGITKYFQAELDMALGAKPSPILGWWLWQVPPPWCHPGISNHCPFPSPGICSYVQQLTLGSPTPAHLPPKYDHCNIPRGCPLHLPASYLGRTQKGGLCLPWILNFTMLSWLIHILPFLVTYNLLPLSPFFPCPGLSWFSQTCRNSQYDDEAWSWVEGIWPKERWRRSSIRSSSTHTVLDLNSSKLNHQGIWRTVELLDGGHQGPPSYLLFSNPPGRDLFFETKMGANSGSNSMMVNPKCVAMPIDPKCFPKSCNYILKKWHSLSPFDPSWILDKTFLYDSDIHRS